MILVFPEIIDKYIGSFDSVESRRQYYSIFKHFFSWLLKLDTLEDKPGRKKTVIKDNSEESINEQESEIEISIATIISVSTKQVLRYKEYLVSKELKTATINNKLSILNSLFHHLNVLGIITSNPFSSHNVKRFRDMRVSSTQDLDLGEVQRLLEAIDKTTIKGIRDYALIALLFTTGLRRHEVVKIQWADFRQDEADVWLRVVGKGGLTAEVLVLPWVLLAILDYQKINTDVKSAYVFASISYNHKIGKAMTSDAVLKIVKYYAQIAGISIIEIEKIQVGKKITPHSLRHTFVTQMAESGAPLHYVQKAARHASLNTTQRYIHEHEFKRKHPAKNVEWLPDQKVNIDKKETPDD